MSLAKVTLHNRVLSTAPAVPTRGKRNLAEHKIAAGGSSDSSEGSEKGRKRHRSVAVSAGAISDGRSKSFLLTSLGDSPPHTDLHFGVMSHSRSDWGAYTSCARVPNH